MPVTPDSETSSRCPPERTGAASAGVRRRRSAMRVSDEALIDDVDDAALESTQRFFAGLPFCLLAEVVAAAGGVVADLGDGGHVDGVVQTVGPREGSTGVVSSIPTMLRSEPSRCAERSARRSESGGHH